MLSYSNTKSVEAPRYYTKKKTTNYKEQDAEKVKSYEEQIKGIPVENIAYIDETGIDTYLFREHGYAPKGQKIYDKISGNKYKRVGIVAAKIGEKIFAPMEYDGTMDSLLFETWFVEHFLPVINEGTVIVMDNASFHRKKQLICAAQKAGCILIFLPPYSPKFNPIEKVWSWLKRYLRKILHFHKSFKNALFKPF